MSYSISSDPRMTEQILPLQGSLSRLPSFMAAAARKGSAAGNGPESGNIAAAENNPQSGPQAADSGIGRNGTDSVSFSSAGAGGAANAADRTQEEAYLSMGRASKRGSGLTTAPSAGENALPGAANAVAAAEPWQSGQGAPQPVPGQKATGVLPGATPSTLLPGETGGSRSAPASGADEARSPERSFMGGQAAAHGRQNDGAASADQSQGSEANRKTDGKDGGEDDEASASASPQLSEEEEAQVEEMQKRDREVRTHEQAHIAAGGNLVSGGASYETETGPDGKAYAVGGEVQIDTSEASTPEGTIAKARRIKAAALAPAEPSAQDRAVAAQASQMEASARTEKREQSQEEQGQDNQGGAEGVAAKGRDNQGGAEGVAAKGRGLAAEDADKGMKGLAAQNRDQDQDQMPKTQSPKVRSKGSGRLSAAVSAYERASGAQPPAAFGFTRSFAV